MTSEFTQSDSDSALRLAYQRLLALERFKSGFLARTSHEMRSPINTIVSLHQLILEDLCEGPEEEKEFIEQSKNAALKMLTLFDQITAVSKLDVGREPARIEAVDLSLLLPEVEMLTMHQAANQNVRYSVDFPADELEIRTDRKWLKTILASLVQDAVLNAKTVRLAVEVNGKEVAIVVESDRAAAELRSELNQISSFVAPNTSEQRSEQPKEMLTKAVDLVLSTGLVLATARTALPLIEGTFTIADAAEGNEHSRLQCVFSR